MQEGSRDVSRNGSGYIDITARDAIYRADRELLKQRRRRTLERLHKVANENGFYIKGNIYLTEMEENDSV